MTVREHLFDDAASAAADLAATIAGKLKAAIESRGVALLAVSGGRSPIAVFEALRQQALDWSAVVVTLVDERWVTPEHADSNARLAREHLLQGAAASARFVPMKNDAPDPYAGHAACETAFAALPRPFDVVLLGMGDDGHTASLFPGAKELKAGLTSPSLTLAVTPPVAPHQRMSLTLKGLLDSRWLALQIGGANKLAVYRAALGTGAVEELPVRAVLNQSAVPIEVWINR